MVEDNRNNQRRELNECRKKFGSSLQDIFGEHCEIKNDGSMEFNIKDWLEAERKKNFFQRLKEEGIVYAISAQVKNAGHYLNHNCGLNIDNLTKKLAEGLFLGVIMPLNIIRFGEPLYKYSQDLLKYRSALKEDYFKASMEQEESNKYIKETTFYFGR